MSYIPRKCASCSRTRAIYDDFEDCYLCLDCHAVTYPQDYGESNNPNAGIWKPFVDGNKALAKVLDEAAKGK